MQTIIDFSNISYQAYSQNLFEQNLKIKNILDLYNKTQEPKNYDSNPYQSETLQNNIWQYPTSEDPYTLHDDDNENKEEDQNIYNTNQGKLNGKERKSRALRAKEYRIRQKIKMSTLESENEKICHELSQILQILPETPKEIGKTLQEIAQFNQNNEHLKSLQKQKRVYQKHDILEKQTGTYQQNIREKNKISAKKSRENKKLKLQQLQQFNVVLKDLKSKYYDSPAVKNYQCLQQQQKIIQQQNQTSNSRQFTDNFKNLFSGKYQQYSQQENNQYYQSEMDLIRKQIKVQSQKLDSNIQEDKVSIKSEENI